MSYVVDTLTVFNKTLVGDNSKDFAHFTKIHKRFGKEIAKDFHKIQLNETLKDSGLTEIIIQIMINLGIPPYQWGRYLGAPMSVYQLLLEMNELTNKKNAHLLNLIAYIDTEMGSFWYTLILFSIFSLLTLTLLSPIFFQSEIISVLTEVVTAVLFLPALRIIYNTGYALYSFYTSLFDTHIPLSQRIRNNVFEISGAAIKIAAASLVFVVVATSPIVSILVITATALSVLKEAVGFIQLLIERRRKYIGENEDTLTRQQHLARLDNNYKKTRNDLIMNLVAAVAITAIVAVWTFIPGGLPLVITAITAMALIYVVKMVFHFYNEKTKKKELKDTFEQLEATEKEKAVDYNDSPELEKSSTYAALQEKLGVPTEPLIISEPFSQDNYDPLFQASAGNESEEKPSIDPTYAISSF